MKKNSKLFNKKGGGEILGFVYLLPFILLLIIVVLTVAQVGYAKQKLTYAAYTVCRSVVVSKDEETANANAQTLTTEILGDTGQYNLELLDTASWEKGQYVRCTVSVSVDTLLPGTSGTRSESIVMMIENDTEGDES